MKFAGVFILLICVVMATFSKCLILLAFNCNQQYISNQLCVNKENPASHCDGHCYLSKQLNKEEKPTSPFTSNSSEKFEIQLFSEVLNTAERLFSNQSQNNFNQLQSFTAQQYINLNFHPPKA